MENRKIKQIFGIVLAAAVEISGSMAAPALAVHAEESDAEILEQAEAAETPDVELVVNGVRVSLKNETGITVSGTYPEEAEEQQETVSSEDGEASAEVEAGPDTLILVDANEERHVLEGVDLLAVSDAVLTEANGFFYLSYVDESLELNIVAETAEEKDFEEPVTMYMVDTADLHEEADSASSIVGVASSGMEVTAIGASPEWVHVILGETEGYVEQLCISRSREDAASAAGTVQDGAEETAAEVQAGTEEPAEAAQAGAEEPAEAAQAGAEKSAAEVQAAAAAAQAAAVQAAAQADMAGTDGGSGEKTEVSRQKYDDCDGSGHGYYEIIYSDGTTEYEEY